MVTMCARIGVSTQSPAEDEDAIDAERDDSFNEPITEEQLLKKVLCPRRLTKKPTTWTQLRSQWTYHWGENKNMKAKKLVEETSRVWDDEAIESEEAHKMKMDYPSRKKKVDVGQQKKKMRF